MLMHQLTGVPMFVTGAVELMRTMMAKSKRPGHLWPMAMYSWEVMPPPAGLEKNLGERRLTGHAGTGESPAAPLFRAVCTKRFRRVEALG